MSAYFFIYVTHIFSIKYFSYVGVLFWEKPVRAKLPAKHLPGIEPTKVSAGDQTYVREVTGLEVINFHHSTTEAAGMFPIYTYYKNIKAITDTKLILFNNKFEKNGVIEIWGSIYLYPLSLCVLFNNILGSISILYL